jgi:Ca2+-binding RTX toxin-like protein
MRLSTRSSVLTLGLATTVALLAPSPASAAPAADVSIAAEAHPAVVAIGGMVTITFDVTNDGPDAATNVTIDGHVGSDLDVASLVPSVGLCTGSADFTCSLGSLPNGGTSTVTVSASPTVTGRSRAGASVSSAVADPDAGDGHDAVVVRGTKAPTCTIQGTGGRDRLRGTAADDVICGLGGNDRLLGRGGDDTLLGGTGNDGLRAGAGADRLRGGAGRDRLLGGGGRDVLAGGARSDRVNGQGGRDRCRRPSHDRVRSCP